MQYNYGKIFEGENICSFHNYTANRKFSPLEYLSKVYSAKGGNVERVQLCAIKSMGVTPVSSSLIGGS